MDKDFLIAAQQHSHVLAEDSLPVAATPLTPALNLVAPVKGHPNVGVESSSVTGNSSTAGRIFYVSLEHFFLVDEDEALQSN